MTYMCLFRLRCFFCFVFFAVGTFLLGHMVHVCIVALCGKTSDDVSTYKNRATCTVKLLCEQGISMLRSKYSTLRLILLVFLKCVYIENKQNGDASFWKQTLHLNIVICGCMYFITNILHSCHKLVYFNMNTAVLP